MIHQPVELVAEDAEAILEVLGESQFKFRHGQGHSLGHYLIAQHKAL